MTDVLYHITPRRHLPSIMVNGLIPGHRRGLTVASAKRQDKVYLTNNPDYIMKTQAGDEWLRRNDVVILAVDVSEIDIKPVEYRYGATYTISDFEFTTDRVHPRHIALHENKKDAI